MSLRPGDVFQTATRDIWYVDTVSQSGAYCIHLSAHPSPITTRRGVTKVVKRHLRNSVFSLNSIVDLVDPNKLDQRQLNRRIDMARKEGAVAETPGTTETTQATRPAPVPRATQKYRRTDKMPAKEQRGQAKETLDAINAADGPLTAEEVGARCEYKGSRQDKTRVAGFYLSQFKKEGLVSVVAEAAPVATKTE